MSVESATLRWPARKRQEDEDCGYGLQLREKQKSQAHVLRARRPVPQLLRKSFEDEGRHGRVLLQQLERRLDNIVYRMGFAMSAGKPQLVRHATFGERRKVNIPSFQVSVGQEFPCVSAAAKWRACR